MNKFSAGARIALHKSKLSRRRRHIFLFYVNPPHDYRTDFWTFYQSTISIFIIWMALHISRSKQSDIPGFAWVLERQIERLQTSRLAFSLFASGATDNGNLFADNMWRKVICDVSPQNMCKRIMKLVGRKKEIGELEDLYRSGQAEHPWRELATVV